MAQIRARRITGGNILYYEGHPERIIGSRGGNVFTKHLTPADLNLTTVDPTGWTTTVVEVGAGTTEFIADLNGRMVITAAANENDGGQYQWDSLFISGDGSTGFAMSCVVQFNDIDQIDFFFGCASTDTSLLGGVADAVYFESLDGAATFALVAEKNSTETTSTASAAKADATDVALDIYFDGTTLRGYVDGVEIYDAAPANLPDDALMRPSIAFLTGEAVANTCSFLRASWTQWVI